MRPRSLLVVLLGSTSALTAQTSSFLFSPAGSESQAGGGVAMAPFGGGTATYQQVHDYEEMVRLSTRPFTIKGVGFRPAARGTMQGRTYDARLSIGVGPNSSGSLSSTFSNNLTRPTLVFGSSTGFSKFSFQTVIGAGKDPNPIAFVVPFSSKFVYLAQKGRHLVWQWQHRAATRTGNMACDAPDQTGKALPGFGKGCGAFSDAQRLFTRGLIHYQSVLSGAPARTPAPAMFGLQRQVTKLPGWCADLEIVPVHYVWSTTNAFGSSSYAVPIDTFKDAPSFVAYCQYAHADTRQATGIGLSTVSAYRKPPPGAWTTASVQTSSLTSRQGLVMADGLVVAFQR